MKKISMWERFILKGNEGMNNQSQDRSIFLSYSHADKGLMAQIQEELEKRGFSVWTDKGLKPGTESWKTVIEETILKSQGLVVLLSPDAKNSLWVEKEIDFARVQEKKIYPILGKGTKKDSIPIELINSQWIDIREKTEIENQLDKLASTIQEDIEWGKEQRSITFNQQSDLSHIETTSKSMKSRISGFLKQNGGFIGIILGIVTIAGVLLQFLDSPSIQALITSPTGTPTKTIRPSQTQTPTPISITPSPTNTESLFPPETVTPSQTATLQPSPTNAVFPGQDWLKSCINDEIWTPYGEPGISPDRENSCWSLEILGFQAQTGDLSLRRDISDPTNRENIVAIYSSIPSSADTVRLNLVASNIVTKGENNSIIMMGFVPLKSNSKIDDWKKGRYLYMLVGIEGGNPKLMLGEPEKIYDHVELPARRIFGEEYQVKLTLIDGNFSIFVDGTKQGDSIPFPYFQYGFWIGYRLRDGSIVNVKITELCFESSSGDFSTCVSE